MAAKKDEVTLSQRQRIRKRNEDPALSQEHPDPTPIHIPGLTDVNRPLTLREEMRRFIRETVSEVAAKGDEIETFEEANDFEIEDDLSDMLSSYTVIELAPEDGAVDDLEGKPAQEDVESVKNSDTSPSGSPSGVSPNVGGDAAPAAQVAETGDAPSPP